MKNLKSLLFAVALLPAALFASETQETKNCSFYCGFTPTGVMSAVPGVGVRIQQNPFLMDASLGGRYVPTFSKVMLLQFKHHFSYIFNHGSTSQNYFGVGACVNWEHHFRGDLDEVSYSPFLVVGKDFTMMSGKKLFLECHYVPYIFGKDSHQLHIPELKLGCAF